jgi:hypothetical protein
LRGAVRMAWRVWDVIHVMDGDPRGVAFKYPQVESSRCDGASNGCGRFRFKLIIAIAC